MTASENTLHGSGNHAVRQSAARCALAACLLALLAGPVLAQSVCLPAPRLLTTLPMGGQVGTEFEVTVSGDHLEDVELLAFSHPGITAVPKTGADGEPVPNRFVVTIAADCPVGVHDARVMTRLGVSSSRAFSVGDLPEVLQTTKNTTPAAAMELEVNSLCNAVMTARAVDHYRFTATKGQRIIVDCAARGVDSKLNPVLIVADADGRDLQVERRGGAIDFRVPADGAWMVKVHDLTFNGGPQYFYRLALREVPEDAPVPRLPVTETVSAFSWPPPGLPAEAALSETEPNDEHAQAQKITLPCDVSGSFYPAADVDRFEFTAKKGEVWWIEVASERLGLPTAPAVLVQRVVTETAEDGQTRETLADVAGFSDIPSPVKISTVFYAYDGPPYNAGSSDVLAKLEIPEDGLYRLQLTDRFGGTRNDPRNVYRMVIREAAPDFALVGWALHMGLRNGDRNALSKPVALRGGATMALEMVVIRRDGFDGEIAIEIDGLPEGVTAAGLKIPAGKSRGIVLFTAREDAPRGMSAATITGHAVIDGEPVVRPCRIASMAWPIPDHWQEVPSPRLVADLPVSVITDELAPLTITTAENKVYEVTAGEKLTLPLTLARRCDFSGSTMQVHVFGNGFEHCQRFDMTITGDTAEVVLDLAQLKTPPGDYTIALYGGVVSKYRYNPGAVVTAEEEHRELQQKAESLAARAKKLAETSEAGPGKDPETEAALARLAEEQKALDAALAEAEKRLKQVTEQSKPKDIVDIVVSEPVAIRVRPAE